MNNFNFKLVNKDQLMNIVKQVKREKRRKRDTDERRIFLLEKEKRSTSIVNVDKVSTGKNEVITNNSPSLECPGHYRDSKNRFINCHQKDNNRALPSNEVYDEQVQSTCNQNYSGVQCSSTVNLNRSGNEKIVTLIRNVHILRERFLRNLDAFLLQHEENSSKERLFKNSNNKFKERLQRKIKAYQYQILKMDYQLVLDMKNLNHCVAGHDVLGLLKVLSKCHSSALQIFQVFLRGLPEILEKDREKNKFCELLNRMVTLSNFCKFIRKNITEIKPLKDLLVDDLKERCKSILYMMEKKMIKESQDSLQRKMKASTEWDHQSGLFKPFQVTENTKDRIQMISPNKIHISKRSFRKLVKKVFGAQEQSRSSCKGNGATKFEDGIFVRVNKLPKERNQKEEIRKIRDFVHKEDENNDRPSNIKLVLGSNIDTGLNCISVGTQYSSSIENNVENFDVESFSKKLYIALETKLDNYFQNFCQRLSKDQCQRKVEEKKNLQIEEVLELKKSDSVNTSNNIDSTVLPEEPFQSINKNDNESNLKQQEEAFDLDKEVTEAGEVFRKHSKENSTLSNEENKLKFRKSQSNTVNKQLNSSCDPPSPEKCQRNLPNKKNMTCFNNGPWEMIGSISDRLIEECLNSISCEIDSLITQMVIDPELT